MSYCLRDFSLIPRLEFLLLLVIELFVFVSNALHGLGQLISKELRGIQRRVHQKTLLAFFDFFAVDLLEEMFLFFERLFLIL